MSTNADSTVPEAFADVFDANDDYVSSFALGGLEAKAAKGLAIITCMDSRIAPLEVLGLQPGDAKILRNAGARVTGDVLRTLVLAVYLLGVKRVLVMPHTQCRMAQSTEAELHELIDQRHGIDTSSIKFKPIKDPIATLRKDIAAIASHPLLPQDLDVAGAIYDVATGKLTHLQA
ncbi:MAG: carbonic anhydrase [Actinobacteria bacterium]|uniref:Unannotated protein n=1 Tax=freshwater metagenome TaxID=449393 RepID=A0A6J6Y2P9_9ZZZZ|nr:carbonic anhydrase [Actinomycetota bacterium]MSX83435.1 carbonic anhydrase [Actinomycetota bacterium]MSZ49521.1 carbonic anhydrase [Actinomycetota bacterium]